MRARQALCSQARAPGTVQQQGWQATEDYKVLLDDEEATLLVTEAAEHLSKADLPIEVADALAMGTAMMKDNGRVRGIMTGDTFRRGVARTMHNNAL